MLKLFVGHLLTSCYHKLPRLHFKTVLIMEPGKNFDDIFRNFGDNVICFKDKHRRDIRVSC